MANWGFGNTSFNSSPPQEAPSTFSPFPVWDASIQQTPSTIDANSIGVGSASLARKQISPEEFVQVGSGKHWSTGAAIATKKTVPTVPELTSAAEAAALEAQKKANLHNIEEEISGQNLYKTELCRSFEETGACRYGSKCQFAHGRDELRPVLRHPKYKTEVCKTFHTIGTCPYGKRCRFIHGTPPAERKQPTSPTSHPINQVNESKQNAMLNSWSSQWPGQQKQQPQQQQQQQQQQQSPQLNTSPKQSNQYVNSPGVFQSSFSTPSPQVMTQKKPQSENWARSMRAPSLQAVPRNSYGKINDANVTSYFNAPFTPSATIKPTLSRSDPTGHPSYNREMLNNGPPTIFVPRAITTSAEAFTPISNNTVVTPKEYYSNSGGEQQAPTIATSSSANNSPNNSSEESSRRLSFFNNLCEPPRNNFHLTR